MLAEKPAQNLMQATNDVLQQAVSRGITHEVPEELTAALEQNTFIFSGFKTYHELREASTLLKDENGGFKPFERFLSDVQKINNTYNRNYLHAEYNHAVQSTQMAVKWHDFEQDGDRYDLQYRTANDGKVREEHAILHNTTLPPSDPFWDKYLPPNGWNCRCTVVQVRKGKYPTSDPELAMQRGDNCTAKPKQQIFRFNPGKSMKVFPEKHPYLPKGCGNCKYKDSVNLVFDNDKAICKACRKVDYASVKWSRDRVREHYKKIFNGKEAVWNIKNGAVDKLNVSYQDIRTITGKPHDYPYARNMSVYYLESLLKEATYIGNSKDIKGENVKGHTKDTIWHYYEIPFMGQKSYLEIKEVNGKYFIHHLQDGNHFDSNKINNRIK